MERMYKDLKLGFVGQGWVGKNYADSFADRGYDVVRYALEEPYVRNKDLISGCDIAFIAVPTPSTPEGFDDNNVKEALSLVGKGKLGVIKSTIPPGTTRKLAAAYPGKFVVHVPEFLRESYARYDVDTPERMIVGLPEETDAYRTHGELLVRIHPQANYTKVTTSEEAEFLKYAHNTFGYATIVFANVLHDFAATHGIEWGAIKEFLLNNPWYPSKYLDPVHKDGRGAGGHCFIKDFAAFREAYAQRVPHDKEGLAFLRSLEAKNNMLLRESKKDLDLLEGVYGKQ